MNKTKILTVLGVLLAMSVTACGSKNNSKSSADGSKGGASQTSQTSGGGQSGGGQSSGGEVTPAYVPPVHHWSEANTDPHVDADPEKGTVGYWTRSCTDHTGEKGIEIAARSGTLVDNGSLKNDSSFPDYMKLDKIGNGPGGGAIEYKFEYTGYATGVIFQRAVMDYWHDGSTNNQDRGYYSGKGDGETVGNFKLEVNGKVVDFSKFQNITYGDMLPEEKNETGNNYSQLRDCEIGEISIHEGINTIKYTRVDSYNMVIKDFVLAVTDVANHEHTLGDWAKVSDQDCEHAEVQKATCSVCGAEVTRENPDKPALGHDLGTATEVQADAENGYVYYKKAQCSRCHKFQYEIPTFVKNDQDKYVFNGVFVKGGNKTANPPTPDAYMKLNADNDEASFKFNLDKVLVGKIYQLGIFDNWPSNSGYGYFSANDSKAQADIAHATGNFQVFVNGEMVDLTWLKPAPMSQFIKNQEYQTFGDDTTKWSYDALCPIGEVTLDKGVNTINYKRIQSYNLAVKALVLIVDEFDHDHTPADAYQSDENGHWHACSDPNCPAKGVKLNYAAHEWVDDDSKEDHVATDCGDENIHYQKCVCGKTHEVRTPSTAAHNWEDKTAVQNTDSKNVIPMECSVCHHVGAKMSENDYSSADFDKDDDKVADAIRPSQNKPITYKIVVSKAGTYSLEFSFFCKSNGGVAMSERKFSVKVNDVAEKVTLDGTKTPDGLGMSASNAVSVELCSAITLKEGENTIALTCASYRLHYKGNLAVYEK